MAYRSWLKAWQGLSAAPLLLSIVFGAPAGAQVWTPTGEVVRQGHRLATFHDALARRGSIRLNDQEIAVEEEVSEIGKVQAHSGGATILFTVYVKSASGCGSDVLIAMPAGLDGKAQIASGFGACNSKKIVQTESRGAWYVIAFRDDRATAQVALMRDGALTIREVNAQPCLFVPSSSPDCVSSLIAEAAGSSERGRPTGEGRAGGHKAETFINASSGKATLEFDGRVFRTFESAKDFRLIVADGEGEVGLFVFLLKPAGEGCVRRPLAFFSKRGTAPQFDPEFAPCADQTLRTRTKRSGSDVTVIAFGKLAARGYVASVTDGKLATRTIILPPCFMEPDGPKSPACVAEALAGPAAGKTPQVRTVPVPRPAAPAPKESGK